MLYVRDWVMLFEFFNIYMGKKYVKIYVKLFKIQKYILKLAHQTSLNCNKNYSLNL